MLIHLQTCGNWSDGVLGFLLKSFSCVITKSSYSVYNN